MTEEKISEEFTRSFANVLNRHGYGFQFSVLEKVYQLGKQNQWPWRVAACEFPVEGGPGTRIDFVLSWFPPCYGRKHFLIAEESKSSSL